MTCGVGIKYDHGGHKYKDYANVNVYERIGLDNGIGVRGCMNARSEFVQSTKLFMYRRLGFAAK